MHYRILPEHAETTFAEKVDGDWIRRGIDPEFDHEGDSGRRLYVLEGTVLPPYTPVLIPHGIAVVPTEGYHTEIRPRSSSLKKKHVHVALGTIDAPYRGELMSCVIYMPPMEAVLIDGVKVVKMPEPLLLKAGERVSQLVEVAIRTIRAQKVDSLDETTRGAGAFGSTGG